MRLRVFLSVAFGGLLLMTYGFGRAATVTSVWVALSENGGVHAAAADALHAELERTQPGRIGWRVAHWSRFTAAEPPPQWVVAVGIAAQRGIQDLFAGEFAPPPLLTILVPRLAFERIAEPARLRAGSLSAVFLDQPPGRQLELVRLALPAKHNVGLLISGESKNQVAAFEKAAKEREQQLLFALVGQNGLAAALQSLLVDAEVLLALPDPAVFNSQTAASILTATYRRQVPLVGFSPAYVKAGALLAVYSTPQQVGTQGGELLRQALNGKTLPPPQWPHDFAVSVNRDVAHSLGLDVNEARLLEQLRQKDLP